MESLELYANLAEIFGGAAIIGGGLFAILQIREFRKRRRSQIAVDLCQEFTKPELARAVSFVRALPDDVTLKEIQDMDPQYQESAQVVGMTFETMGLLIHRNIASFDVVQSLTGGLAIMMWGKIRVWIEDTRTEFDAPRFGEWTQWLVERLEECESDIEPAHIAHRDWNKHLK